MVEDSVKNDFDAVFVKRPAHFREVLVGAEPHVDFSVVAGVVAVRIRLKNGREVDRVYAEPFHMRYPVDDFENSVLGNAVVFKRRPAEPERIDLIKNAFISPHSQVSLK